MKGAFIMAVKFNLRLCLQLIDRGISLNTISKQYHISKHTSSKTKHRMEVLQFDVSTIDQYSDDELGKLFFPEMYESENIYLAVDYDYVHKELSKPGVNLKLLWKEYCLSAKDGKYPVSYSKYCRGYAQHVERHNYTNHIEHKPGIRTEIDWSGPTMHYMVPSTGELVKVYLFVATLPFSQYSYVEPTKDMKINTWINCNKHMFEYFGGSTVRIVCDNLKTGVVSHPKEGEIILTDMYSDFGNHYMTAIMPAQVRKPKQKASVEGTVGKIATTIIASLRNVEFHSFEELYQAVREKLDEFNTTPFQKRDGSRKKIFEAVEKQALKPLPEIPFEVCHWFYSRKVQVNCHITYQKNWYSVPYEYVGKSVDLKVSETTLTIYYQNKRINIHKLFPAYIKNKYSTYEQDMPESVKVSEWDDVRIKKWASKIGPYTRKVVEIIFEKCKVKEQGYNPAMSVLHLSDKYSNERLELSCQIALSKYPSPRYKHLNAILSNNQDKLGKQGNASEERKTTGHLRGAEFYGGKSK